MKVHLKIWRQKGENVKGRFETYTVDNVSEDSSKCSTFSTNSS